MKKQVVRSCQEKFSSVVGDGSVGTFEHCKKQFELQKLFDPFVENLHNSIFAGNEAGDGSIGRFTDLNPVEELRSREDFVPVRKNKSTGEFEICPAKYASHIQQVDWFDGNKKIIFSFRIVVKRKENTFGKKMYYRLFKDIDGETFLIIPTKDNSLAYRRL